MRVPAEPREVAGASPGYATHEILNQPSELESYDAFADDMLLVEAVRLFGADWADKDLRRAGALVGSERVRLLAQQANRAPPELRTHGRFGHRVDVVEFHPAYHELMGFVFGCGTHSFAFGPTRGPARTLRAPRSATSGTRARTASAAPWA